MSRRPPLLLYCQHSLGLGHLARSLALCEALAERFEVTLLSGGTMPPDAPLPAGLRVVSLPPLSMGADGALAAEGAQAEVGRTFELRARRIRATFDEVRPRVLVIELFPFGRKKFAPELLPLLERAREHRGSRPLVACSLRDILVSRSERQLRHDERAAATANRWFDLVLVHSDPEFARLDESFRPRTPLRIPVHHTGFVAGPAPPASEPRTDGVVVSAGGGRVGEPLMRAAIEAHPLLVPRRPMRLIAGPLFPAERWDELERRAAGHDGLELVRSVPDLGAELRRAAASVSQCGYNTALDLVRSGTPALVVPFAAEGEDEQARRAERLAALGAVRTLDPDRLDGARLAAAIDALEGFQPRAARLDLDGGRNSAAILARALTEAEAA